jgi:hypothetical protein
MVKITINYIGTDELAELCGVKRRTVNFWIAKGYIPKPERVCRRNRHPLLPTLQAIVDNGLAIGPEAQALIHHHLSS